MEREGREEGGGGEMRGREKGRWSKEGGEKVGTGKSSHHFHLPRTQP